MPLESSFVNLWFRHFRFLEDTLDFSYMVRELVYFLLEPTETLDTDYLHLVLHVPLQTLTSSSYRFRAIKLKTL